MGTHKAVIRERQARGRGLFWLKKRVVLVGRETEEERLTGSGICRYFMGKFGVHPSSKMLTEVS